MRGLVSARSERRANLEWQAFWTQADAVGSTYCMYGFNNILFTTALPPHPPLCFPTDGTQQTMPLGILEAFTSLTCYTLRVWTITTAAFQPHNLQSRLTGWRTRKWRYLKICLANLVVHFLILLTSSLKTEAVYPFETSYSQNIMAQQPRRPLYLQRGENLIQ